MGGTGASRVAHWPWPGPCLASCMAHGCLPTTRTAGHPPCHPVLHTIRETDWHCSPAYGLPMDAAISKQPKHLLTFFTLSNLLSCRRGGHLPLPADRPQAAWGEANMACAIQLLAQGVRSSARAQNVPRRGLPAPPAARHRLGRGGRSSAGMPTVQCRELPATRRGFLLSRHRCGYQLLPLVPAAGGAPQCEQLPAREGLTRRFSFAWGGDTAFGCTARMAAGHVHALVQQAMHACDGPLATAAANAP